MPGFDAKAVVVVEDDSSMQQALERILRLGGHRPVIHPTAEALLARLDEEPAHVGGAACLIVDVQLPGMNGFALREHLAREAAIPPVIFITAFDDPDARAQAARAGAAAFLAKPFSGRLLLQQVALAVGMASVR